MEKRTFSIVNLAAGLLLGVLLTGGLAFKTDQKRDHAPSYASPPLPEKIAFAGEAAPLERWDVKERLDREVLFNYYNHAGVLYLMKMANRYFPIISERLAAAGVPDDFKYLCIAESNLSSGAVSRAGAVGFWQFMDGTAPGFGLEVNSSVDFRREIERSTDAACRYLKGAYAKFGTWTGAAASYNCGQGGYNAQATFQGTLNYYDLQLPDETNRYIFRILTFKYLLENAADLGFVLKDEEKYPVVPFRTVTVNSTIPNLAQFARDSGTTYKMLRLMNPWLRGRSLTVTGGKSYAIKLPATTP